MLGLSELLIFDHVALKARIVFKGDAISINTVQDEENAWKGSLIIAKILNLIARRKARSFFISRNNIIYYIKGDYIFVAILERKDMKNLENVKRLLEILNSYLSSLNLIFVDDLVQALSLFFSKIGRADEKLFGKRIV